MVAAVQDRRSIQNKIKRHPQFWGGNPGFTQSSDVQEAFTNQQKRFNMMPRHHPHQQYWLLTSNWMCVCGNEEKQLAQLIAGDRDWSAFGAYVQLYHFDPIWCRWSLMDVQCTWGSTQYQVWFDRNQPLSLSAGCGGRFKAMTGSKCILDEVLSTLKVNGQYWTLCSETLPSCNAPVLH